VIASVLVSRFRERWTSSTTHWSHIPNPIPRIADSELNPDTIAGRRELSDVLKTAMQKLPERYQAVIRMYYNDNLTMREIGDSLGINESRVSQIHRAALEKMAENLQAAGIHSSECVL